MRIVIFGANGSTGCLLTRLSLTAGYDTVAVTRQPGTFPVRARPRDALARLHEQYLRCGLRNRDDTGYMRRVVPGYERKQPRW
jgi:hypothetical protein